MRYTRLLSVLLALATALPPAALRASCGSASCPIDSNALNQPAPGSWAADLSFQYIDQDEPRIGTRSAFVGEIPSDHDEVRTINRTANLSLHYAPTASVLLGITIPWIDRFHRHLAKDLLPGGTVEQVPEQWKLRGAGDLALDAQWRALSAGRTSIWLTGALKLPTGRDDRSNGAEVAELPIQTGTGSTDVIVGAAVRGSVVRRTAEAGPMGSFAAVPWFATVSFRRNGLPRRLGSGF